MFSPRALRQQRDHPLAARYLETLPEGIVARPSLLKSIDFRQVNLVDAAAVEALGSFDLVVCRNVLIYFDEARVHSVVSQLAARIRPEGALLIGVSESLMRFGTSLTCEEHGGSFVYRRAASRS